MESVRSESIISQNTLAPISLLIVSASAIFWLATMYVQGSNNEKAIFELRSGQATMSDTMSKIEQKISRLEAILERSNAR
jgi:hypothetical protein